MLGVAFMLGLMGSLHCVGMCGPLAILACSSNTHSKKIDALLYNVGRVTTYSLIGAIFGILGTFLFVSHMQKSVAISIGVLMIVSFLLQKDIDKSLGNSKTISRYRTKVQQLISYYFSKTKRYSAFVLGMLNGLIPCGLVYLALAGAVSASHWTDSMLFMTVFGAGTMPAMMGLLTGYSMLRVKLKKKVTMILPFVTLIFGCFLIYRGIQVEMPLELSFWEAMKNPIMCH